MRWQVAGTVSWSVAALFAAACQSRGSLPELMTDIVLGEPDPHYRGKEHIRMADAVVVAVVKEVVERGRPFVSEFSPAIYLQQTEVVIEPEYVIKGEVSGATVSVRANLLSYESQRALGYRAFKPQPGQRWVLFLRRERDWRMLFDLLEVGVRVSSGKPDPRVISQFGNAVAQTAAVLVTPGPTVKPESYCDGLPASAAYAGLLVEPEDLLRMLAIDEAPRGGCVRLAIAETVQSIRDGIEQRSRRVR